MRNIRIDICYDGTRYRGWQCLPGTDMTLQGKLEQVLSRILDEPIEISGSGRTDAGVHAMGQVASFHCRSSMPCGEILIQLRRYLPEDIGIYSCKEATPRFHARLNAVTKTYRYRVWIRLRPACLTGGLSMPLTKHWICRKCRRLRRFSLASMIFLPSAPIKR